MEIREWIRSLGDRARLLVVIPLVAGSLAALVTLVGPASFQASATVIMPEDPQAGAITGVTQQRVADFTAAVRSEGVLDKVSRDTEVPRGDLDAITVSRSGSSGVVVVGFSGSDGDRVARVAEAAARTALAAIAQAKVDAAQAELDADEAGVEQANEALSAKQTELGMVYSADALQHLQRQAEGISDSYSAAVSNDDLDLASELIDKLERKQNRINDMLLLESLNQRRLAALQVVFGQQAVLFDATGSLNNATALDIEPTRPVPVSKLQVAARRFVFVAAIGFFLALGLVLLLQLMDRRSADADEVGPRRRPAA